jgi:hypothetical protein
MRGLRLAGLLSAGEALAATRHAVVAPKGAQNTVRSASAPASTAPAVVNVSSLTRKCWVIALTSRKRRWSGLAA